MFGISKSVIRVAKLTMQESGTYNPIHQRPYVTHVDNDLVQAVQGRLEQAGPTSITGAMLAGVAGTMMMPAASPGNVINIPYGWAERRIRFILEVHATANTGVVTVYYFQGYTSHLGVSSSGAVDPKMIFILNSFIRVRRVENKTPMGYYTTDEVTQSAQILNSDPSGHGVNPNLQKMRPQEVFTGIHSGYINNQNSYTGDGIGFIDTRIRLGNEPIGSNRANNLPTNFISKVFDAHRQAHSLEDFGQGEADIITRGSQLAMDSMIEENPFIRSLSQVRGVPKATAFMFEDLMRIDPNSSNMTNMIRLGNTHQSTVHQTGQSEYWNSANRETVVATILSNAVPSIMMSLFISKVTFMSTNHSSMGLINTVMLAGSSITSADMSGFFQRLKDRLDSEVFLDISYGGQQLYTLEMDVDIFGETKINISIDGSPPIMFVTPSFCDGLMSPVISPDLNTFNHNVHNFEHMLKVVENSVKPSIAGSIINRSI
jgi:hypothetical protein